MARLAGVDIPRDKRVEYALTYIYGIGLHTSRKILSASQIDPNKRVNQLTDDLESTSGNMASYYSSSVSIQAIQPA